MRPTFSILLICFILGNVFAEKTLQRKISIRNLDESETTDIQDGAYSDTPNNQPEYGEANAPDTNVTDGKPVSTKGTGKEKKDANVQVLKFHNYFARGRRISFRVLLYFLRREISRIVRVRLRIAYASGSSLRYLDEDSVLSTCTIQDDSLVGRILNSPANFDYNCEATAIQDKTIAKVSLNTDFDMQLSKLNDQFDTLNFNEINFNGNSGEESQDLSKQEGSLGKIVALTGASASSSGLTLKLKGKLEPDNLLSIGDSIDLSVLTGKKGERGNFVYKCVVKQITPECELDCDTSSNPLDTTLGSLHLSTGNNSAIFLTVYMTNNGDDETTLTTSPASRYTYPKSSSGLSGGAICWNC